MSQNQSNLPATFAEQIAGVPKALVPATLKALDRLIGGVVDIPAAWLAQQKAKIDAQTEAYKDVEAQIAKAAAAQAGASTAIVGRAVDVLVRNAYKKQTNREAVGAATLIELSERPQFGNNSASEPPADEPEEEWLNVFERYAEEASTERMQKLWGRVLAGEIRSRGSFSMRSLRFLSEFSQSDATLFAWFCENVFAECVPISLVRPDEEADIRDLLSLQAADLIDGVDGAGLQLSVRFDEHGFGFFREANLVLLLSGMPGGSVAIKSYTLTPVGRELIKLLDRDPRRAARKVAAAIRTPQIKAAHLAIPAGPNTLNKIEMLWTEDQPMEAA